MGTRYPAYIDVESTLIDLSPCIIFTEVTKTEFPVDLHEVVSKQVTSIKQFVKGQSEDKTLDAYVTVKLYNINSTNDRSNVEHYVTIVQQAVQKVVNCNVVVKPIYNKDSDANALDAEAGCAKANKFFISFTEDVVPSFTHVPQYNIDYPHPQQ